MDATGAADVTRTTAEADVRSTSGLGALYLGGRSATALASAGPSPASAPALDRVTAAVGSSPRAGVPLDLLTRAGRAAGHGSVTTDIEALVVLSSPTKVTLGWSASPDAAVVTVCTTTSTHPKGSMMSLHRRRWPLVAATTAAALTLAACSGDPIDAPEESPTTWRASPRPRSLVSEYPREETVFTSGTQWGPPSSWNPLQGGGQAMGVRGLLYETLFVVRPVDARARSRGWPRAASGPTTTRTT